MGAAGLSRRRLLRAVPAALSSALLAGAAPRAPVRRAGRTAPSAAPPPQPSTAPLPGAGALPALRHPVFTLEDYRRVVPGPAFPTDAVALTIDDGPHPVWTPQILRLLDRYQVPALFCMIGNQVLGHEAVARTVLGAGHHIANHTWSHRAAMSRDPEDRIRLEIARAQEKIHDTTGYTPTLFRSPGGQWSPALSTAVAQAGMIPIDWSDDPRDWARPGVPAITSRLLTAKPNQIILCHDGGGDRSQTFTALQSVIPALQARGYRFVALDASS